MRKIKRQSRSKELPPELVEEIKIKSLGSEDTKNKPLDKESLNTSHVNYEEEIRKLKAKLAKAEGGKEKSPYSKNEEKILSAVKSEKINQRTDEPVISRSMLIKKYGLNSKYIDKSIKGLELKKAIARSEVSYSSKITTFSWRVLN